MPDLGGTIAGAMTKAQILAQLGISGPDVMGSEDTQTQKNKTINVDQNTIKHSSTNQAGDLLKSDGTKLARMARGTANQFLRTNAGGTDLEWTALAGGGDMLLATPQTITGAKTFADTKLLLRNPGDSASATVKSGNQSGSYSFSLPVVTANDEIMTNAATQTATGKTINATNNTITDTSTVAGDLMKSNGTKFVRMAKGSALQHLRVNAGGTDLEWTALGEPPPYTIAPDYVVYKTGATYYALDGAGNLTSNSDFATLMTSLDTALASTGGSIFFKKGTYEIGPANHVDIYSDKVHFIGAGRGVTIFKRTLTNSGNLWKFVAGANNCSMSHITIDGNYPSITNNEFEEVSVQSTDNLFYDMEFIHFDHIAIVHTLSGNKYVDCVLTGENTLSAAHYGIFHYSGDATMTTEIRGCKFRLISYGAIAAEGNTLISHCYFSENAIDGGAHLGGGGGAKVTILEHSVIRNGLVGAAGVEMGNGYWIVRGCTIENNPHWGICTNGNPLILPGFIVENNIIRNNDYGGILIQGDQHDFVIQNNLIIDDQVTHTSDYGITIGNQGGSSSAADRYIVRGNICQGNILDAIQDRGTGVQKTIGDNIPYTAPATGTIAHDYIVYVSGGTYYAVDKDGATTSDASFTTLMGTLNTALSSGGSIFIKAGTYNIDTPLTLSSSLRIIGAGIGKTTLKRTVATTATTLNMSGANSSISYLTIDGNHPTNQTAAFGELGISAADQTYDHIEIKNFYAGGTGCNVRTRMESCVFTGVGTAGVSGMGVWSDDLTCSLWMNNCTVTGCDLNAVFAGGYAEITNCYFSGNAISAGGQIAIGNNARVFMVSGCIFDAGGAAASGIEFGPNTSHVSEVIFTGNRITAQAHYGIVNNAFASAFRTAIIKNNIVKNCGYSGIYIDGAQSYFTIEGNSCFDDQGGGATQDYGIRIANASSNHFILQGNLCWGNVSGQISDTTPGTADKVVRDNIPAVAQGSAISNINTSTIDTTWTNTNGEGAVLSDLRTKTNSILTVLRNNGLIAP